MNTYNLERAWKRKAQKGYEFLFWVFDLHNTIIPPSYNHQEILELYPYAKEVLQYLAGRKDMILVMWTSTHPEKLVPVLSWLKKEYGIEFHFVNCNPLCPSNEISDFSSKFYFDVLVDDKAGFVPETDWKLLWDEIQRVLE